MTQLHLPKQRYILCPAPIWKRALAFLIDLAIINVVIFSPFQRVLVALVPSASDFSALQATLSADQGLMNLLISIFSIVGILAMLYFVILEYVLGMTLGMRIMRIHVSAEKPIGFWRCIARNLFFIPLFPFPLLWIIDPLHLLFSHDNARFLERLTKTRTVERVMVA